MTRRRIDVPGDLASKEALLAFYGQAFAFPDWWGRNWDALYDLLSDPALLAAGPVEVLHASLPGLPPDAMEVYRELLDDVVADHGGEFSVRWPVEPNVG